MIWNLDSSHMQFEASKNPFGNNVFIVKRNRAALRSAYEATITVCDFRDKPFHAEEDYPAIAVQHRLVGSDMKHHADLEQYTADDPHF
jgi:hypothetical protein